MAVKVCRYDLTVEWQLGQETWSTISEEITAPAFSLATVATAFQENVIAS